MKIDLDNDKSKDEKELRYLEGELERGMDWWTERVIDDLDRLLDKKGKNYGDTLLEPINIFSDEQSLTAGIDLRLDDKLARIKYSSTYKEDTYIDIMGYIARRIAVVRRLKMKDQIDELKTKLMVSEEQK